MKNILIFTSILYITCTCTREFSNDCDSKSISYKPLKANFTLTRDGSAVTFFNNSENAENFEWQFSDGTKSTEKNMLKTFSNTKPIVIKLIASRCGNYKKDSTSQTLDMNCGVAAPAVTYPTGSSLSLCTGQSIRLTASVCTAGTPLWSNGATNNAIDVRIAGSYTVRCLGSCQAASSVPINITVIAPKATAESLKGTSVGALGIYSITFNGKINFNSQTIAEVTDHGFVYIEGTGDPNTSKGKLELALGKKSGISSYSFSKILSGKNTNQFSYRAFLKLCDGTINYGAIQSTK